MFPCTNDAVPLPLSCVVLSWITGGFAGVSAPAAAGVLVKLLRLFYITHFCLCSERCGGERRSAIAGQTRLVLPGQLATPPRVAQENDGETRAQGTQTTSYTTAGSQSSGSL